MNMSLNIPNEGYVNIPVEFFVKRNEIDENYEEEYEDEELKEVRF